MTATVGQIADRIARKLGATKTGQGQAYRGNRSRYYTLRDGRSLRISDHEPAKVGGSVTDINVTLCLSECGCVHSADVTFVRQELSVVRGVIREECLDAESIPGLIEAVCAELAR